MLDILHVDHVGLRIREKERSVAFYSLLGFVFSMDAGFEDGHPIIMKHPSGVTVNLLGPSTDKADANILMDVNDKHTGITHIALRIKSREKAEEFFAQHDIAITGRFEFHTMKACFIRDPDKNVIELDELVGDEASSKEIDSTVDCSGYDHHC